MSLHYDGARHFELMAIWSCYIISVMVRFSVASLHHLAARRISQHPAGKSCRVFALTPAARFPLASRPPPYRVLCIVPFFVLPTLAGALRAFLARRISQHPAGKSCRVFALTPAARFPLASRTPPYRVLCILSFFVLPTLAGALRAFSCKANFAAPCRKALQGVCINACGSVSARVSHSARQSALHFAVLRATNARGCAPRFLVQGEFRNTLQESPAGCLH